MERMRTYLKKTIVLSLAITAFALATFGLVTTVSAQQGPKLTVVTTTNIVGDTVRRVVGDAADVISLMGPGVDPHLYQATHGDLRRLSQADVIFLQRLQLGRTHRRRS